MRVTLAELACLLTGERAGDGETIICGLASLEQAQAGDLAFLAESKPTAQLAASRATAIDRATLGDTIIESGVKLDNMVQIGHNSVVGAHSVLAGQVGLSGSVRVGSGVRIGGQAGSADHITVGDKASISAQAGVIADIEPGVTVYGTPAVAAGKRIALYSLRLGELFQQVKELQRRLDAFEGRETRS